MVSRRQQEKAFERARVIEQEASASEEPESNDEKHESAEVKIVDAIRQGEKKSTTSVFGHEVEMKVLNAREEMEVMTLVGQYEGKFAYPLAFNTATFAMSVISIDDKPFIDAISLMDDTPKARYNKARKYYSKFIEAYMKEYVDLKDKADAELESIKK